MVRHKSRWLLVHIMKTSTFSSPDQHHIDTCDNSSSSRRSSNNNNSSSSSSSSSNKNMLEKKQIFHALKTVIESSFGIAGSSIIETIQVTYIHPEAQITILKVPRDYYKQIQAACTLLTTISTNHHQNQNEPIVASILSIHGSARTCKIATIKHLRKWFFNNHNNYINRCMNAVATAANDNENNDKIIQDTGSLLKKLHQEMEAINV